MQRRMLIGIVVGGCVALGAGLVLWAGTQGLFGPHGRAKRLMAIADHDLQRGQTAEARTSLEQLVATFPESPLTDEALMKLGQVYEQEQQPAQARDTYRTLLEHFPASSHAAEAQTHLGAINVTLLFSHKATEGETMHEVKPGDTLGEIARGEGTTVEMIKHANNISNDVIRPGQKLKIPKGHFRIVVDKSQNQMLVTLNNEFFKLYHVSTGKDNSTPVGSFKIVNKVPNPVWYHEGAAVPSGSPDNVLGTRWMGLDKPSYGIHGTVDPNAIGQQVTAGCVRMSNSDVEELFDIVPVGTEVMIAD